MGDDGGMMEGGSGTLPGDICLRAASASSLKDSGRMYVTVEPLGENSEKSSAKSGMTFGGDRRLSSVTGHQI